MRGEIPRLRETAADKTRADKTGRKKKPGRFARDDKLGWSGSTDVTGRNDDFEWSGRSNFMIAMIGLDAEG